MQKFSQLKKEIAEIISKSRETEDPVHSKLTLKWLLKLKPKANEAMQIAALAHDIERAVTGKTESTLKNFSNIQEIKNEHAKKSAEIIGELMAKYGYGKREIQKVKRLVARHESGGDRDSDILRDADSIAYFDYNIYIYIKKKGFERTKEKIKFMYGRISRKTKKIVEKIKFKDKEVEELFREAILENK